MYAVHMVRAAHVRWHVSEIIQLPLEPLRVGIAIDKIVERVGESCASR
jgi:hypothetical protein